MSPIATVLLICATFSSGIIALWRSYYTPASLPSSTALVDATLPFGMGNNLEKDVELERDLELVGKDKNVMVYEQLIGSVVGVLAGALLTFLLISDTPFLGIILAALLGLYGWHAPKNTLIKNAEEQRVTMKQALVVYQELASAAVSGGQSIQSALRNAATYGEGKQWAEIRHAATVSMTSDKTFASHIRQLHDQYQINELETLANVIEVADSGGTSKTSLQDLAKQQSKKFAQEALDKSESNTAQLLIPTTLIFISFVLLLAFVVMDGLSQITL